MPRLFTALTLPDDVTMWLSGLHGGLKGARWIDPENYHVTLRFIGDVDHATADEIVHALDRVARAPIPLTLSGLGSFGSKKPHSVWARVEPTPALMELQGELERLIQRLRLPAEGRRYTPHVTLARLRGTSAAEAADWLSLRGGFFAPTFTADHFALMSSKDSVGGGPYVVEDRFALRLSQAA